MTSIAPIPRAVTSRAQRGRTGAANRHDRTLAAARNGQDLYEEFAAYRELAEARRLIRSPDAVSRRQIAGAVRILRGSDDAGDRWVADNLARTMELSDREIERSARIMDWPTVAARVLGGALIVAAILWGIPLLAAAIAWIGGGL